MIRRMVIGAMVAVTSLGVGAVAEALPASLVDKGERATVLVDVNGAEGRSFGSAFCINDKGIYITDGHVVRGSNGKIKIVIRPGEKDQRVLAARVLGVDYQADLAVMSVDKPGPVTILSLGNSDAVMPTQDVTAFGYPFGNMLSLDKDAYPSVSVNSGKVTALRKQKGELGLIQMDALVNPGDSGGPVMDADGKVIGIVESGVPGAGLNFATPIAKLKKMMQGPLVLIDPVSLDYAQRNKPTKFSIAVNSLVPGEAVYDATLQITDSKGTIQTVSGKTSAGKCDLTLVPSADTTALKWNPFTDPPPTYKFTLTLTPKDSKNAVNTQEGVMGLADVPLDGELVKGNNPGSAPGKGNPMDPLPANAEETAMVGPKTMNPLREVNGKEQLAVGIHYTTGVVNKKPVIGMIRLIFGNAPSDKGENVMAKEGYVVGGFNLNSATYINGLQVIFIRSKNGKLDPSDTYTGDWIGIAAKGAPQQLGGTGERVIGICGHKGVFMRAMGLVIVKPAGPPATQPAKH